MTYGELLKSDVQTYLKEHTDANLAALMLKKSPFPKVSMRELVVQIKGRQVAKKKYPFLLKEGIVFPEHLNLEQSSSMATAQHKSVGLEGNRFVDLTCGFGIDAYFLSRGFKSVDLVERNSALLEIVKHNWSVLNREAQFIESDLQSFLLNSQQVYDLIYLDPARRDSKKNKVFLLEDLSPNLLEIQKDLLRRSKKVLIKLSPLIDLTYLNEVLEGLIQIEIIALKNEVKEVLVTLGQKESNPELLYKCVNLESNEPDFVFTQSQKLLPAQYSEPLAYLYIPNNAILKSGAFSLVASRFELKKLAPNTHLYTSNKKLTGFPGRILRVEPIEPTTLSKNSQFNIISKNYPLKPQELKVKYKLKDGGEHYLIFTESVGGKIVLKSI